MWIEYILWLQSDDAVNNRTVFAKAPNRWTQIEHNMCGRRTAWSPLYFFVSVCQLVLCVLVMIVNCRHRVMTLMTFSCWSTVKQPITCLLCFSEFVYFVLGDDVRPEITENQSNCHPLRKRLIDRCDDMSEEVTKISKYILLKSNLAKANIPALG